MIKTNEGAMQYEHSLDHALEFFSKANSLFIGKESFYGNEETALSLFQKSWIVNKELTMKLLFWLRNCRGGAGNRSAFRECLKWLASYDPEWVRVNLELIPVYGRWDDLRCLFATHLEKDVAKFWANAIKNGDVLAAKWADRTDKPIKQALRMKVADFRRLLASIRKHHIVEYKMCNNLWHEIDYEKVPSVAMARYTNAFNKHDEERFRKYKESLKKDGKINANVLFPHDCVRTAKYGDREIADAQFEALPDYIDTDERILVIADTSGSMCVRVSGSIEAVDISQGLALYCSAKIPENNPFHKKFIEFSCEGEFVNWKGMSFSEAVNSDLFKKAVGSTRIDKALKLILDTALFFNLTDEQLPTMLLIVSDMQFSTAVRVKDDYGRTDLTPVEAVMKEFRKHGYNVPKIVYWNLAGYAGSPATASLYDIALVSGFSPSILKAILKAKDFTPLSVMYEAIKDYKINIPQRR